jgi:2-polyprenyl-3-methyl-5-hydroxy-6-metoxy-1,4-benzoquinol methylase
VYRLTSWAQRLRPEFLSPVSIPAWLSGRAESAGEQLYQTRKFIEPEKAKFILRAQIHRAGKQLGRVEPKQQRTSTWSSYTRTLSYAAEDFKRKSDLVRTWLTRNRPASVLDIGCNTGHFSDLAAETGAQVVAIDTDPVVVGSLWARAAEQNLSILPLIVNFAWPTPGVGWRNEECPSFLSRATGRFETVMMLAVLHHVIVTERVPLEQIVDVCDSLTTRNVIVEYVSREDEMFRRLTRGREALYRNFTQEHFEIAFGARFQILEKQALKGELRWLYLLEKKVA